MTATEETAKKEGAALPPICPILMHAFLTTPATMSMDSTRCMGYRCAWRYICDNLSNLERIAHDAKTKTI